MTIPSDPSRRIRIAAVVNGAATVLAWVAFFFLLPVFAAPVAGVDGAAERLAFAARLSLWPALVLFGMVMGVVVARALSAALNPIDDAESRLYRVSQRVLGNTVEQTLVFLPAFLALATVVDAAALGALPLVMAFFVGGRLLFWAGYLFHPYARAPGMATTFSVNAGLLSYLVWQLA